MNAEEPLLGVATTRQLLLELSARFEITTPRPWAQDLCRQMLATLSEPVLQYRTVDDDPTKEKIR